jgi:hypothetical protein
VYDKIQLNRFRKQKKELTNATEETTLRLAAANGNNIGNAPTSDDTVHSRSSNVVNLHIDPTKILSAPAPLTAHAWVVTIIVGLVL